MLMIASVASAVLGESIELTNHTTSITLVAPSPFRSEPARSSPFTTAPTNNITSRTLTSQSVLKSVLA